MSVIREIAAMYLLGALGFLLFALLDPKRERLFTVFQLIGHALIWPYHFIRAVRIILIGVRGEPTYCDDCKKFSRGDYCRHCK